MPPSASAAIEAARSGSLQHGSDMSRRRVAPPESGSAHPKGCVSLARPSPQATRQLPWRARQPRSGHTWPNRATLGRRRVKVGRTEAERGSAWPNLNLAEASANLVEASAKSIGVIASLADASANEAGVGRNEAELDHTLPEFGRAQPVAVAIRATLGRGQWGSQQRWPPVENRVRILGGLLRRFALSPFLAGFGRRRLRMARDSPQSVCLARRRSQAAATRSASSQYQAARSMRPGVGGQE